MCSLIEELPELKYGLVAFCNVIVLHEQAYNVYMELHISFYHLV